MWISTELNDGSTQYEYWEGDRCLGVLRCLPNKKNNTLYSMNGNVSSLKPSGRPLDWMMAHIENFHYKCNKNKCCLCKRYNGDFLATVGSIPYARSYMIEVWAQHIVADPNKRIGPARKNMCPWHFFETINRVKEINSQIISTTISKSKENSK